MGPVASCLAKVAELWLGTDSQFWGSLKFGFRKTSRGLIKRKSPVGPPVIPPGVQKFKPNKGSFKFLGAD